MDQTIGLKTLDRQRAIERLTQFVAASFDSARASDAPFHHLQFDRVFPDDVYAAMLTAMPVASDYRPMSGRAKGNDLADGTHTRVKIDLFPEYIRKLPPENRFGNDFAKVGMYPVPILTRDTPGYKISPHPDTHWKGMTIQLYLPRDSSTTYIGTIFHEVRPDGSMPKHTQMKFAPNTGYAFAVGDSTWHSADTVGPEVTTRDSILLTYFVDSGVVKYLRNRGKRIGNFLLNEFRHIGGR